jgi:non-ribosomal peptide synthetase component F
LLEGPEGQRLWSYWERKLEGANPVLDLPHARQRPATQTYRGDIHRFEIDRQQSRALKELAKAHGTTPYAVLLAVFEVLLFRYTGQDDILIGSPTAGRSLAHFADVVGYFANPVVVRADLSGSPTFTSLLGRVRQTVLEALAHQDYPFSLLVERLQPPRDLSRSPIFQVVFAWDQPRRLLERTPAEDDSIVDKNGAAL